MANINQMIADLDQQINSLRTAKQALLETAQVFESTQQVNRRGVGGYQSRPQTAKKRTMSPEAREKIRAAQKLRWAKVAKGKKADKQKVSAHNRSAKRSASNRRPRATKQAAGSQAAHLVPAQAVEPVVS